MSKPPAFQFYASDFLAGTQDMSNEEVGAYVRLLCHQWDKGGIPNDPARISMMAGAISTDRLGYVLAKFRLWEDGQFRNDRMEAERLKQSKFRANQAEKGKECAEKRWKNRVGHSPAIATAMPVPIPEAWPEDSSPSPYSSTAKAVEDTLTADAIQSRAVESNPQITPPTLEQVKNVAAMRGFALDCAESFWNANMGTGWVDGRGVPIRNWTFALNKYAAAWRSNDFQRDKRKPYGNSNERQTEVQRDQERTGLKQKFNIPVV